MQNGDIYCCDWNYTTNVWGTPYKKVGTDGAPGHNGSDATVPKYITETIISKGVIEAPQINANNFGIYPSNSADRSGGFTIHGMYGGTQHNMFGINYFAGDGAYINIDSEAHAIVHWNVPITRFHGQVDFGDNHPTAVLA